MRRVRALGTRITFGFALLPAALTALFGGERRASAADSEVTSETAAQFYDVRSPTGEVILPRRRVTTTLGVSVYNLGEEDRPARDRRVDPRAPDLSFRARLRYDADYGPNPAETNAENLARFIPGFERGLVDLMYGYIEGRRYLGGLVGFRLGRQYLVDPLGWYAFDGASVKLTTPYFVALEAYGGLEVRGGLPLATSRWERDGVLRGDRSNLPPNAYPSFQPAAIAPVYGAAIESAGFPWLHGRLTYRRAMNTGASNPSQFASGLYPPTRFDETRVSQERVGYAANATWDRVGGAKGGVVYDLYIARVTSAYASLDAFATRRLTLSVDYDYYRPSYDGDSIWNFFVAEPMSDVGLRANFDATDKLAVSGGAHARILSSESEGASPPDVPPIPRAVDTSLYPARGTAIYTGGHLATRYRFGEGAIALRGSGTFGETGRRVGADLSAERVFETRYVAMGRLSFWDFEDALRPTRAAASAGYVTGIGYRFAPRSQAMVEWEHNVNRLAGHRFRVLVWLSVAVLP